MWLVDHFEDWSWSAPHFWISLAPSFTHLTIWPHMNGSFFSFSFSFYACSSIIKSSDDMKAHQCVLVFCEISVSTFQTLLSQYWTVKIDWRLLSKKKFCQWIELSVYSVEEIVLDVNSTPNVKRLPPIAAATTDAADGTIEFTISCMNWIHIIWNSPTAVICVIYVCFSVRAIANSLDLFAHVLSHWRVWKIHSDGKCCCFIFLLSVAYARTHSLCVQHPTHRIHFHTIMMIN